MSTSFLRVSAPRISRICTDSFDTCDSLDTFETKMNEIVTEYGGDLPESLLSASFHVMKELNWKLGSTKSLVVLTDAGYHSPDRDGTTFGAVAKLSKEIDPVNFYIITNEDVASEYIDLANETGGKVVTDFNKLTLLTDYIINRNDSLPRVEEESSEESPILNKISSSYYADTIAISFSTNGTGVVVVLNDYIVGITVEKEITISDLDRRIENEILLAPIDDGLRGDAVRIIIPPDGLGGVAIPNAPNTGGH